jgi:hypothetical protein
MFAFFSAFALTAQQSSKKPIPSSKTLEKATEVIDTSNNIKDTISPVKKEEPKSINVTNTESGGSTGGDPAPVSASEIREKLGDQSADSNKPSLFVNFKASFELLPEDEHSQIDYVEYKINDSDYMRYTGPIRLSKEGSTTIAYRSVDRAGNAESPSIIFMVVDNTPPVCTLKPAENLFVVKGVGYASAKNSYAISAEDTVSGVKEVLYSVDNGEKIKYQGPVKLETPGFHSITYYGTDTADNTGVEQSYAVSVDDVKPTIDIVESLPFVKIGERLFARKGTKFKLVARDAESGVAKILYRKKAEDEFTAYVEDLSFDTTGEYTIQAKAIDNVGNESDIKELKFVYDVQSPKTKIKYPGTTEQ